MTKETIELKKALDVGCFDDNEKTKLLLATYTELGLISTMAVLKE